MKKHHVSIKLSLHWKYRVQQNKIFFEEEVNLVETELSTLMKGALFGE